MDKEVPLRDFLLYFVKLGTFGFGGPVVLCEHMRRDLVETKQWISQDEYSEGFALSQLAPGPLAAQLAIYLGWVRGGVPWATLAGLAFILPSLVIVFVLSALYILYGGLNWIQGAFYGIGASVIAIIAMSAYKLVTKTFKSDKLLWALGTISAIVTAWTQEENLWLFIFGGVLVALARNPPKFGQKASFGLVPVFLLSGLSGEQSSDVLWKIFLFFAKAGALVFGSGLAIVPFLHHGVVIENHWLTEKQFIDAVAVAMITPGPVVVTVAFIGYLVSGPLGGFVAALGVFLPCYLFVVIPAPYYKRFANNVTVRAVVDGITATAIGAIAGAAYVLGRGAITDASTALIAVVSLIALMNFKKLPEPVLILIAGVAGLITKGI